MKYQESRNKILLKNFSFCINVILRGLNEEPQK